MMAQQNKQVVEKFFECVNTGDFETLKGLFADGFRLNIPTNPEPVGTDFYLKMIKGLRAAFPEFHLEVQQVIAEGDLVAVRDIQNATFNGEPFMGLEPNGRSFTGPEHPIFRIKNGKIQEMWGLFDTMGFMAFIGAAEPPKLERPPASAPH